MQRTTNLLSLAQASSASARIRVPAMDLLQRQGLRLPALAWARQALPTARVAPLLAMSTTILPHGSESHGMYSATEKPQFEPEQDNSSSATSSIPSLSREPRILPSFKSPVASGIWMGLHQLLLRMGIRLSGEPLTLTFRITGNGI